VYHFKRRNSRKENSINPLQISVCADFFSFPRFCCAVTAVTAAAIPVGGCLRFAQAHCALLASNPAKKYHFKRRNSRKENSINPLQISVCADFFFSPLPPRSDFRHRGGYSCGGLPSLCSGSLRFACVESRQKVPFFCLFSG